MQSGTGRVVLNLPVAQVLRAAKCASTADCFALATVPGSSGTQINREGGLALLANFPDLRLPNANIKYQTALTENNTHVVVLTSDHVALFAVVRSSFRGKFDRNGVLLLPGEPQTFRFIPWGADLSSTAAESDFIIPTPAFQASLTLDAVNLGIASSIGIAGG